jgi:hypothetical protein
MRLAMLIHQLHRMDLVARLADPLHLVVVSFVVDKPVVPEMELIVTTLQ